jgi:hypothetical protein
MQPRDPSFPPSPNNPIETKVHHLPYGFPLIPEKTESEIDINHIIFAFEAQDAMRKAYMHISSGIQIAGADTLSKLVV